MSEHYFPPYARKCSKCGAPKGTDTLCPVADQKGMLFLKRIFIRLIILVESSERILPQKRTSSSAERVEVESKGESVFKYFYFCSSPFSSYSSVDSAFKKCTTDFQRRGNSLAVDRSSTTIWGVGTQSGGVSTRNWWGSPQRGCVLQWLNTHHS